MPTRAGFDLIQLRRETKERLARLKQDRSFDEVVRELLDRAESPAPSVLERPWPAHKQDALADMAAKRWQRALSTGQILERGPRLLVYRTGMRERRAPRARLLR